MSPQTYDAIFAISSAHHVFELENLLTQCRIALKPGSLLFQDKYIGPSRFQTPPLVNDIINRLSRNSLGALSRNLFANDGSTIDRYTPPTIEHMEGLDPSEAIHSAEIVEFRPYCGGILHMLFSGIMGPFDENDDTDVALLQTIATFEEVLRLLVQTRRLRADIAQQFARYRYPCRDFTAARARVASKSRPAAQFAFTPASSATMRRCTTLLRLPVLASFVMIASNSEMALLHTAEAMPHPASRIATARMVISADIFAPCIHGRVSARNPASRRSRGNAPFTILYDLGTALKRAEMSIRRDNRAIAPGAEQARPALALILNLLLISP